MSHSLSSIFLPQSKKSTTEFFTIQHYFFTNYLSCIANIASLFFNAKIVYYKGSLTYYDSYTWVYDNAPKGNSKNIVKSVTFVTFLP